MLVNLVLCSCAEFKTGTLSDGKVLLDVSSREKRRLLTRLGFTNAYGGAIERDSKGERLCFNVRVGRTLEQRKEFLVVVTADGVHIKPWRVANERMTDDEELGIWQNPTNYAWQVRSGEWLPKGTYFMDLNGDWIALGSEGRPPWLARLGTPAIVAAKLPDSSGLVSIFANGPVVHVFARRGWRNAEGPMKYLVYDFTRDGSQPIKEMTLPWARIAIDMDPDTGLAVLNDNNRFWGRTWLLDANKGKRKSISVSDWTLFVKKEVAQQWIELTKP
jgi:hypothetical protein